MAGEPEVEEDVAPPPVKRPRIVVTPNPLHYDPGELGPSAFDAAEAEEKTKTSGPSPLFDDTEIKETRGTPPGAGLRYAQELQGAIPDADPQNIVDQRNAAQPIGLKQEAPPEAPKLGPSAMDLHDRTREEEEDAFDQPYQEAANIPKGFLRKLEQTISPHLATPPPPIGHNMPPPGMGLPPHVPPPPTGGAGTPLVPPAPARKIVHGVSDEPPFGIHELYTQTMDDLHPLKRLQELANDVSPLAENEKSYELGRLTRGSYGRSHQAITNFTYDFNTLANTGPGLTKVLEPVKGDMRAFEDFAVAMRDIELHGRGINSGAPLADAQAIVAAAPPHFRAALNDLHGYQDRILQYVRDSGLLSDDAYTNIKAANRHYVPFNRVQDSAPDLSASASLKTWNPIKRIKGSQKDIQSPIETIVRNTHYLMDLAEKNRVLNSLVDATQARGMTDLVKPVPRQTHPVNVSRDEVEKFLSTNGVPVPGSFYGAPDNFAIFRPNALRPAPDEIVAYKNGKPQVFKVDPEVADAVNGLGHQQVDWVVRAISKPASWLRAGATLSPDFLTKNPARDQFVAAVLSKNGYIPVVDYLRGLGHMVGNTQKYQEWLKSGGANSAIVGMDRRYIETELQNVMQSGAWNTIKNNTMHPIEFLKKASEYGEQPTRIAEFIKATNPGFIRGTFGAQPKGTFMAGYDAREVSTDFGRHGSSPIVRAYSQATAFANPQAQGVDRLGRAMWDNPASTAFKIFSTVTLPTAALYWYSRQDPRVMDAPRWERDLFWYWPTSDWQEITPKEALTIPKNWQKQEDGKTYANLGTIYKFPKNFEIGVTFGSSLERAFDAYFQHDPSAWKDFDKSMRQAYNPLGWPTAVNPFVEQMTNYSVFRERPLISKRIENPADRRYEYDNYTSDTAKMVGSAIANITPTSQFASPKVLENYALGWGATLGRYALMAADAGLHTVAPKKGQPYPAWKGTQAEKYEAPSWGPADVPVLRSWVSRLPSTYAEPVDEFFKNYHNVTTTKATEKRLTQRDEKAKAAAAREEVPNVNMQTYAKAIGNQFKMIEMIQNANNIPAADKTKLIDRMSLAIMKTAQMGNETFYKIQAKTRKQ